MLVIRFSRTGKRNKAQFRIVVQEHSVAPKGRHTEIVGSWNPHSKQGVFKKERIEYWISQGAQISDSVHNLLVKQGVINDAKRAIRLTAKKGEDAGEDKGDEKIETKKEDKKVEEKKEDKKIETKEDEPAEKKDNEKESEEKKEETEK